MKVQVYIRHSDLQVFLYTNKRIRQEDGTEFIGELELDIKPTKKMVKKEIGVCKSQYSTVCTFDVPPNAINIKRTHKRKSQTQILSCRRREVNEQ